MNDIGLSARMVHIRQMWARDKKGLRRRIGSTRRENTTKWLKDYNQQSQNEH